MSCAFQINPREKVTGPLHARDVDCGRIPDQCPCTTELGQRHRIIVRLSLWRIWSTATIALLV